MNDRLLVPSLHFHIDHLLYELGARPKNAALGSKINSVRKILSKSQLQELTEFTRVRNGVEKELKAISDMVKDEELFVQNSLKCISELNQLLKSSLVEKEKAKSADKEKSLNDRFVKERAGFKATKKSLNDELAKQRKDTKEMRRSLMQEINALPVKKENRELKIKLMNLEDKITDLNNASYSPSIDEKRASETNILKILEQQKRIETLENVVSDMSKATHWGELENAKNKYKSYVAGDIPVKGNILIENTLKDELKRAGLKYYNFMKSRGDETNLEYGGAMCPSCYKVLMIPKYITWNVTCTDCGKNYKAFISE